MNVESLSAINGMRRFLQSCAAGAVMVIVTGVKADGGDVVAWVRSGMASADAGGVLA